MQRRASGFERALSSHILTGVVGAFALLAFSLPHPVGAQSSSSTSERSLHLSYRTWARQYEPISFGFGRRGERRGTRLLHQRLRVSYDRSAGSFRGVVEADFATGTLAGEPVRTDPASARTGTRPTDAAFVTPEGWVSPRRAYVQYRDRRNGFGKLGLQTSHWGLGIVDHDGTRSRLQLFGAPYGGDRYFRFIAGPAFSGPSTSIVVAAGADLVYRDDRTALQMGETTVRGFTVAILRTERSSFGLYGVGRSRRGSGGSIHTSTIDAFAEHRWADSESWTYRAAAEAALQFRGEPPPPEANDRDRIRSTGAGVATELQADYPPENLHLRLRSGLATGDSDPGSPTRTSFRFDPNYRVGIVLFDHYLPAASRESYRRLTDPRRSARPPPRADSVVSEGGVENAMYLHPAVLIGEREGWLTGIGVVGARSVTPRSAPAQSLDNGGVPTGIAGQSPASYDLGWELDGAARYRHRFDIGLALEARAEFGILFPGSAFASESGSSAPPVSLLRGTLGADW